jgi:hypothetical protein
MRRSTPTRSGVEGLHDRHGSAARPSQRSQPGHPEVGVSDVGPLAPPAGAQLLGEGRHVLEEAVLGQLARGAGVDVVDGDPRGELHARREPGVVAAGVDDDLGPLAGQRRGERGDVDVLPSGIDAAQHREGARVLGDHRDPHRFATSSRTSSQRPRKRSRP